MVHKVLFWRNLMEVRKFKPMQFFLLAGIHLALFADIGLCGLSSVSSEIYLSESYFEEHESLLDSSFTTYLRNELPIGLCETLQNNLDTKLSVLSRNLISEGAHRKLHSTVRINIQPDLIAEKFDHLWKFVIVERLPSGIFADPFELQHLIERGVLSDATVLGDTNLELPTVASNRSIVEVHVDISNDILSTHDSGLRINIELPLHTRYPPLGENGFSEIEFGSPDLFILGNLQELSGNHSCMLARELAAKSQPVVWKVPCGNKEHLEVVSIVTFVSAVVSALIIVFATLRYPVSVGQK